MGEKIMSYKGFKDIDSWAADELSLIVDSSFFPVSKYPKSEIDFIKLLEIRSIDVHGSQQRKTGGSVYIRHQKPIVKKLYELSNQLGLKNPPLRIVIDSILHDYVEDNTKLSGMEKSYKEAKTKEQKKKLSKNSDVNSIRKNILEELIDGAKKYLFSNAAHSYDAIKIAYEFKNSIRDILSLTRAFENELYIDYNFRLLTPDKNKNINDILAIACVKSFDRGNNISDLKAHYNTDEIIALKRVMEQEPFLKQNFGEPDLKGEDYSFIKILKNIYRTILLYNALNKYVLTPYDRKISNGKLSVDEELFQLLKASRQNLYEQWGLQHKSMISNLAENLTKKQKDIVKQSIELKMNTGFYEIITPINEPATKDSSGTNLIQTLQAQSSVILPMEQYDAGEENRIRHYDYYEKTPEGLFKLYILTTDLYQLHELFGSEEKRKYTIHSRHEGTRYNDFKNHKYFSIKGLGKSTKAYKI